MHKIITFIIVAISTLSLAQYNPQSKKNQTMKITTETNLKQIIVDVRTPKEWNDDGHSDCTVNYPLDSFENKIEELKKYDKVVIVCRSGNRAGIAKKKLLDAGYPKEVENKGAWQNVVCEK